MGDQVERRWSTPREIRQAARTGQWAQPTRGLAPGYIQAGLAVVPSQYAFDFLRFCVLNPQPCPIVDVTEPGLPEPRVAAPGADVRTDLPRYRVYRYGELIDEPTDIRAYWTDDCVAFLIGCSFTFESLLVGAGFQLKGMSEGRGNPIFQTTRPCVPSGPFRTDMVVSMRPIERHRVEEVTRLTAQVPVAHGAPVHVGDPAELGIARLDQPNWGRPLPVDAGEVPVFWACSITAEAAGRAANLPLFIAHAPAHMFVTDLPIPTLAGGDSGAASDGA